MTARYLSPSFYDVFILISHYVGCSNKYRISGFANKKINHYVFLFPLAVIILAVDGLKAVL